MEFLILRRKRDGLRGMHIPFSSGGEVEAVFQDLSMQDAGDLRRDESIEAFAPSMPLRLIEPRVVNAAPTLAGSETWGVRAVGATASRFSGKGVTVAVINGLARFWDR